MHYEYEPWGGKAMCGLVEYASRSFGLKKTDVQSNVEGRTRVLSRVTIKSLNGPPLRTITCNR